MSFSNCQNIQSTYSILLDSKNKNVTTKKLRNILKSLLDDIFKGTLTPLNNTISKDSSIIHSVKYSSDDQKTSFNSLLTHPLTEVPEKDDEAPVDTRKLQTRYYFSEGGIALRFSIQDPV